MKVLLAVVIMMYCLVFLAYLVFLARAAHQTYLQSVTRPEDLMDAPSEQPTFDPETLSEVNHECIP